jgi:hypothetical protein
VLSAIIFSFSGCTGSEDSKYSNELLHEDVLWAILDTITHAHNTSIAGGKVGKQNITANGPGGGTVRITGNTSLSGNGIETLNLTYTFTNYRTVAQGNHATVTINNLTGVISRSGSWRTMTILVSGYKTLQHSSSSVTVDATLERDGYKSASYSETCNFSSTSSSSTPIMGDTSGNVSGTLCGESVGWSYD